MKKLDMKQIGAIGAAAGIILGGAAGYAMQPEPQVIEKIIKEQVPVEVLTEVEVVKEVPVEVVIEKVIEVPMNGSDELVEFIVDQDGDLSELDLSEIEDLGAEELMDQIFFIRESKSMAAEYVKHELADELDKYEFNSSITLDEDDIERVRVDDDMIEMSISDIDFDDMDADVEVRATFEHDDLDFEAIFTVEIKDGAIDDITRDEVNQI